MKHKFRYILTFNSKGRAVITDAQTNTTMTAEEAMKQIRTIHGTERAEPIYIGINSDDLKHETRPFSVELANEILNKKKKGEFLTKNGIQVCLFKTDARTEFPIVGIAQYPDRDELCLWDTNGKEKLDETKDLIICLTKEKKKKVNTPTDTDKDDKKEEKNS